MLQHMPEAILPGAADHRVPSQSPRGLLAPADDQGHVEGVALHDGSGLQVTVFEILSADGRPLNKVGVIPDEVIQSDVADTASGTDPVLTRAVEILHDQIAGGGSASAPVLPSL